MTISRRLQGRRAAVVLLAGVIASLALLIGFAGSASAADVEVDSPAEVTVGTDTEVTVVITETGEPLAGIQATLSYVGAIGGKSGWVEVDRGVSDDSGSITFTYKQTALQGERMRVQYTDTEGKVQNSPFEVSVIDGPQQHTSSAGAKLGIVGVWWLIVVLAIVWTLVLVAVSGIVKVGRDSDLEHGPVKILPRFAFGFVAFTAVGMLIVILTRPTMHSNLDPTADFGRVPPALVGTEYDYVGFSSAKKIADRPGDLSGEELYVQAGCVGCHGAGGLGAVVGGALIDVDDTVAMSLNSFVEEVREGPKEMPEYSETRLTDDEIARMHEYLYGPPTN